MEDHKTYEQIPYIVHESAMSRNERLVKRLVICILISIFLIFLSNGIWLYAWMQYDYEGEIVTTTQDGKGVNINSIGGSTVDYGAKDNLQTQSETPEK